MFSLEKNNVSKNNESRFAPTFNTTVNGIVSQL